MSLIINRLVKLNRANLAGLPPRNGLRDPSTYLHDHTLSHEIRPCRSGPRAPTDSIQTGKAQLKYSRIPVNGAGSVRARRLQSRCGVPAAASVRPPQDLRHHSNGLPAMLLLPIVPEALDSRSLADLLLDQAPAF